MDGEYHFLGDEDIQDIESYLDEFAGNGISQDVIPEHNNKCEVTSNQENTGEVLTDRIIGMGKWNAPSIKECHIHGRIQGETRGQWVS